ncbi:MAG: hypothetical protein ABI446_07635 [Gemmatimonadaceae bacterium]
MSLIVHHRALGIVLLGVGSWFALGPRAPRSASAAGEPAMTAALVPASPAARRDSARAMTRVSMRHVDFYVDSAVVLHIRQLDGVMRSKEGGPILFDDKNSFVITIDTAEVGLTATDLTTLLNKYVFGYKGSPLTHLHVYTAGDQVVLKGRMHKVITFNFEITANIDVTNQSMLRMHPTKTKVMGLNGEKLLKLLGLSLEKLLDLKGATGATVHGNDLFLDPTKILPPPTIEGRVTAVRVDGEQLVQQFGGAGPRERLHALVPPDTKAPSYMYFKGGTLRFGKLLMLDAEMQIVDLDKSDVFHFDIARYNAQLVAGYERTLADGGLEVWMRDVEKLGAAGAVAARPAISRKQ